MNDGWNGWSDFLGSKLHPRFTKFIDYISARLGSLIQSQRSGLNLQSQMINLKIFQIQMKNIQELVISGMIGLVKLAPIHKKID